MKKGMKDYTGLSLKIAVIFLVVFILIMIFSTFLNTISSPNRLSIYEIVRGVIFLSMLYFYVSVIYAQFKDKRSLWGIIDVILLIFYLFLRSEGSDDAMFPFIIVLISCLKYYFSYIKPKFKKKR